MQMTNLLLDTHIWIWLMNGDPILSARSRALIDTSHREGCLFVSAISTWEVAMLEKKKRIVLNQPCIEWVKTSLKHGIQLLPLTPEIAVESCHLPDYDAGDPADRMIIATARMESLQLLTCDERIIAYGEKNRVAVISAQ